VTNDWLNWDDFIYNNPPPCPRCKKSMHVAVLSGGSDPTGHTDEYFCEWCPSELNIRVIIKARDPIEMARIAKTEKFEKEHPIICKKHFNYAIANVIARLSKEKYQKYHPPILPVRANL
jgi:hypothetical protein